MPCSGVEPLLTRMLQPCVGSHTSLVLGLPPSRHAASATCQVVCCLMAEGMKRWRCVAKCPALLNRGAACWRSETFPPLHGRGALRSLPRTAPCSSPAVGCVSLLPPPPHQARAAAFRCRSRAALAGRGDLLPPAVAHSSLPRRRQRRPFMSGAHTAETASKLRWFTYSTKPGVVFALGAGGGP